MRFIFPLATFLSCALPLAVAESGDSIVAGRGSPIDLTDTTFDSALREYPAHSWLLELYAPWCRYCQQFAPQYIQVAKAVHQSPEEFGNVMVARIDIEANPALAARFMVTRLPSFYYITGKSVFPVELNSRSQNALLYYLADQDWKSAKAVSWLMGPFGPVARLLGFTARLMFLVQSLGNSAKGLFSWVPQEYLPVLLFLVFLIPIGALVGSLYWTSASLKARRDEKAEQDSTTSSQTAPKVEKAGRASKKRD
ncbi:thioredoxin-like protein [Gonapodya prolifera JEL478]|uniref:Thioredoxin-like protein n=1 Tax=Gonapodya prolifera (strain JEL478) TaxID=1344416 RepID=A0A139AJR3_GONPJ|nr:thioredoxin-like protein [Gonapodya prolifera JEL478]|eukprot:KXS16794.1 thioredoxin-like protein [Gonapodya prolifera JEL478]